MAPNSSDDLVLLIVIAMMVLLSEKVQQALIGLSLDHQYPILLLQLYLLQCHHNDEDEDDVENFERCCQNRKCQI